MKRLLVVLVTSLAMLLVQAGPASAHIVSISHGPNWGKVQGEHRTIIVHDGHCGGSQHVARVDYYVTGSPVARFLWDNNGCSAGDEAYTTPEGTTITRFRLCESPNNDLTPTWWCTPFINV